MRHFKKLNPNPREDKKSELSSNTPCGFILLVSSLFLVSAFSTRNIFNHMKEFFKQLLSDGDSQSSKRFSAILTLLCYLVLSFLTTFKSSGILPEYIQNGLLMIIIGGLGLTSIEKIFKKK